MIDKYPKWSVVATLDGVPAMGYESDEKPTKKEIKDFVDWHGFEKDGYEVTVNGIPWKEFE